MYVVHLSGRNMDKSRGFTKALVIVWLIRWLRSHTRAA